MPTAKAVHPDGFDGDAGALVLFVGCADKVAGVFFAPAPFVYGKVLLAHGHVLCRSSMSVVGQDRRGYNWIGLEDAARFRRVGFLFNGRKRWGWSMEGVNGGSRVGQQVFRYRRVNSTLCGH